MPNWTYPFSRPVRRGAVRLKATYRYEKRGRISPVNSTFLQSVSHLTLVKPQPRDARRERWDHRHAKLLTATGYRRAWGSELE